MIKIITQSEKTQRRAPTRYPTRDLKRYIVVVCVIVALIRSHEVTKKQTTNIMLDNIGHQMVMAQPSK